MSHLDGTGLAAVVVLTVAVVVVVVIVSRMVARDREVRVSKVGWFVERERFDDDEQRPASEEPTEIIPPPYDRKSTREGG